MAFVWTKWDRGLSTCYLLAAALMLMIVVFSMEDSSLLPRGSKRDSMEVLVNIDQTQPHVGDRQTKSEDDEKDTKIFETERNVYSVSYYTEVYKHPLVDLRLLTAKDGAPPLRSNISPLDREITIVTQVKKMHARVEKQSGCRLEIQLVTEDGYETDEEALRALYPVNALRNVALGMAKTKLIFLLDADFEPSARLHESLTDDENIYQNLLRKATEEKNLFIVPAFEAIPGHHHRSPVTVPETMEELRKGWENKTIDGFRSKKAPRAHRPTKFDKFFDSATSSPYPITYKDGFEPYVIGALDIIPPYDRRFRGYGANKISHLYACAADGMGFIVLRNVFVFELAHRESEARKIYIGKNKDQDQWNRIQGLYKQFQNEIEMKQIIKDPNRYRRFKDRSSVHLTI